MIRYREIREDELHLLDGFLCLAIYQEDPANPIPRSVLDVPDVAAYVEGWGRKDDHCFVAIDGAEVVGVAWARIIAGEVTGYCNLDEHTPEFSVSVRVEYRGQGVGSELMRRLIRLLAERGCRRASLSVQKAHPAHRLYERLGFSVVREQDNDYLMVIEPGAFLADEVHCGTWR